MSPRFDPADIVRAKVKEDTPVSFADSVFVPFNVIIVFV